MGGGGERQEHRTDGLLKPWEPGSGVAASKKGTLGGCRVHSAGGRAGKSEAGDTSAQALQGAGRVGVPAAPVAGSGQACGSGAGRGDAGGCVRTGVPAEECRSPDPRRGGHR